MISLIFISKKKTNRNRIVRLFYIVSVYIDSRNLLYFFPLQSISVYTSVNPRDQRNPSNPKRKQRHLTDRPVNTKLRLRFPPTLSTLQPVYTSRQSAFSVFRMKEKPREEERRKSRSRSAVYRGYDSKSRGVRAPEREREREREAYAPRDMHYPRHNPRRMIYKSSESRFGTKQKR